MEKRQFDLFSEVLSLLHRSGALEDMVLIGSWCLPLYGVYLKPGTCPTSIRTRDIDLLVPFPNRLSSQVDIPGLLGRLGFVLTFRGSQGYHQLSHPDLMIEFLVPEKGRPVMKPVRLKAYGVNAQALRYLTALAEDLITVEHQGISVRLPHPAIFALHKLMIAGRRRDVEKGRKDIETAALLLRALMASDEGEKIRKTHGALPKSWQRTIARNIETISDPDVRAGLRKLIMP